MIRHRFRTEARLNIGFALFAMALVSLSLTDNPDTPSVWFIAVFDLLLVIWIVLNLGYGTLTMSPRKLLVRGYVRATRIPLAEIASFDSVEARRGVGHVREILTVERSTGEIIKIDPINVSPNSDRLGDLVSELNAALRDWA